MSSNSSIHRYKHKLIGMLCLCLFNDVTANDYFISSYAVNLSLQQLFLTEEVIPSDDIHIKAPLLVDQTTNEIGIEVTTSMPVSSMAIYAEKYDEPLVGYVKLAGHSKNEYSMRLHITKSTNLIVVVESEGKLYARKRNVLLAWGCPGG